MTSTQEKYERFPTALLNCGGLIERIANYTMTQAHRPNAELAFAGAVSWVAHCMGRRYRTKSNGRPNLYILAVGWSGLGKSAPRTTNNRLAKACGLMKTVIDDFRSGEALQDALLTAARLLSQYDEVDTLFNSIKTGRDTVALNTLGEMLKEWEKSGSYLNRRKLSASGKGKFEDKTPSVCFHPHLNIFATGVTSEVYKSISERMATNGFFARLLFIDGGKRGPRENPTYEEPPADVIEDCKLIAGWTKNPDEWDANNPAWDGTGEVIPEDDEAMLFRMAFEDEADAHYNDEEDGVENAVWNRTLEKAEKLAMIFAVSDNPASPIIRKRHWEMARELVLYSNYRQIKTLSRYAAENEYADLQNRILRRLEKGRCCNRDLLASLRVKNDDLKEAVETLRECGKLIFCKPNGEEVMEWERGISYQLS